MTKQAFLIVVLLSACGAEEPSPVACEDWCHDVAHHIEDCGYLVSITRDEVEADCKRDLWDSPKRCEELYQDFDWESCD